MKRFIRYLLLITCTIFVLLLIGSYWKWMHISYQGDHSYYVIGVNFGEIKIGWGPEQSKFKAVDVWDIGTTTAHYMDPPRVAWRFKLLGIYQGDLRPIGFEVEHLNVPIYFPLTPLLIITLISWQSQLKAWWRGTHRQGFEVELKSDT